jgi:hypothetical protein
LGFHFLYNLHLVGNVLKGVGIVTDILVNGPWALLVSGLLA